MSANWMAKASWYELLSLIFGDARPETGEALASGEFAEAFREISAALDVDVVEVGRITGELASYDGTDADAAFHELRKEATRLFIGVRKDPLVIPYAGVWDATRQGKKPLLMVGRESMAIERFMKECRVMRPEGYGGPVDHMGTILEFMSYLCLSAADAVANGDDALAGKRAAKYETFYRKHFIGFARYFAAEVSAKTTSRAFSSAAAAMQILPDEAF